MEQVLYSILSGAGAGGGVVFMFVLLQNQKIKAELKEEFYRYCEKVEHECKEYTNAKNNDVSVVLTEIKVMIMKIQETLMNRNN